VADADFRLLGHAPNENRFTMSQTGEVGRHLPPCLKSKKEIAVFAFVVAMASAQTKSSMSGKCGKPDVQQNIAAGDQSDHVLLSGRESGATKGEVGGIASKED
jgi:hypothetical protein